MKEKYPKFLPLGSIVLLEDATKRLMITGFCIIDSDDSSTMYDYSGCIYPEGIMSSDENILFNHQQINSIYHLGYSDEEEIEFKEKLKELIKEKKIVNESFAKEELNNKNILTEEDIPIPPIGPGLPGYVEPKLVLPSKTTQTQDLSDEIINLKFD